MTMAVALEISALSAGYGRFDVVREIALRVNRGEAVGLLGPNGAGKTTILRAIMGLVRHRRGSILVGETEVSTLPTHKIASGLAAISPEGRRLFLDQAVEDNLILGALHLRHDRQRVQALLEFGLQAVPGAQELPPQAGFGAERRRTADGLHRPHADERP